MSKIYDKIKYPHIYGYTDNDDKINHPCLFYPCKLESIKPITYHAMNYKNITDLMNSLPETLDLTRGRYADGSHEGPNLDNGPFFDDEDDLYAYTLGKIGEIKYNKDKPLIVKQKGIGKITGQKEKDYKIKIDFPFFESEIKPVRFKELDLPYYGKTLNLDLTDNDKIIRCPHLNHLFIHSKGVILDPNFFKYINDKVNLNLYGTYLIGDNFRFKNISLNSGSKIETKKLKCFDLTIYSSECIIEECKTDIFHIRDTDERWDTKIQIDKLDCGQMSTKLHSKKEIFIKQLKLNDFNIDAEKYNRKYNKNPVNKLNLHIGTLDLRDKEMVVFNLEAPNLEGKIQIDNIFGNRYCQIRFLKGTNLTVNLGEYNDKKNIKPINFKQNGWCGRMYEFNP